MEKVCNVETLKYKRLAYSVIRDAIGFYFGIPKFLNEVAYQDREREIDRRLNIRIQRFISDNNKQPNGDTILRYRKSIESSINRRIAELEEDYTNCEKVLFEPNEWLDWLGLNEEYLNSYLNSLSAEERNSLMIEPQWNTSDYDLGRNFLIDGLYITNEYAEPRTD